MASTYSAHLAQELIGKSRSDYQCNHVVNYVLNDGNKEGLRARDYLNWGIPAFMRAPGVVIVNKEGTHVGIFINQFEFIHSSSSKFAVIKAPLDQLEWVFGKDYRLRQQI